LLEADGGALKLDDLAGRLGTSKYHLHRQFKQATGMTPRQYAAALRLARARRDLLEGAQVTEALYAAGYGSSGRFYAESGALGMRAGALTRAGRGETLRMLVQASSLGHVLVATTARGICWVALGKDPAALDAELRRHFSQARFAPPNRELRGYCRRILGWIERGEVAADLPLDLVGTRFQLKVWEELRRLPAGATTSYGELAKQLDCPGAARAVGTAAGKNPVALLVPCHRLLRNDGAMGGYRWGLERKRALLEREAAASRRARERR
jgi:AraC family transcriptional regulator of adaptative response/methylated-DNA-[protein]-cysteine methyltransferase